MASIDGGGGPARPTPMERIGEIAATGSVADLRRNGLESPDGFHLESLAFSRTSLLPGQVWALLEEPGNKAIVTAAKERGLRLVVRESFPTGIYHYQLLGRRAVEPQEGPIPILWWNTETDRNPQQGGGGGKEWPSLLGQSSSSRRFHLD